MPRLERTSAAIILADSLAVCENTSHPAASAITSFIGDPPMFSTTRSLTPAFSIILDV